VDFDITDQLSDFLHLSDTEGKNGSTMRQYVSHS
jgi:hypothetical protein